VERRYVRKYLEKDGKKVIQVRKVVSGAKRHLPKIKEDLELIERLLQIYSATKRERS
jgi:precorrin-6B methylase 1